MPSNGPSLQQTELEQLEKDLNHAQTVIDEARLMFPHQIDFLKTLDAKEINLKFQRARLEIAMRYLAARENH